MQVKRLTCGELKDNLLITMASGAEAVGNEPLEVKAFLKLGFLQEIVDQVSCKGVLCRYLVFEKAR